jgi:hypothetical protein
VKTFEHVTNVVGTRGSADISKPLSGYNTKAGLFYYHIATEIMYF